MKKSEKITFTFEEIQKAKAFIDIISDDAKTYMVQHMLQHHSDVFLPMLTKTEVKL